MVTNILEGGLSNQLFMMSQTIAHSIKYGLYYCIPLKVNNPHYEGQKPYIFPGVKYCDQELNLPLYKEKAFTYEEIPFVDDVCFSGYWQSWKYFDDYREEILKAFNFKLELKKNYCFIHVRLSDYLSKPACHPIVTKEYVFEAMMNVMTKAKDWEAIKFLVFSDGMTMAKEILSSREFRYYHIEYSEGRSEIEDLELMSCCEHNITANSAMSWWGAYLNQNPNKIVVHPRNWFGVALNHDTSDLYLPNSIIL